LVHREKLARFAATWNLRANLTEAGAECLAFAVACREATNRRRRSSSSRGGDRDRSGQDEDEDEGAPPLASLRRCAAGARAASAGGAGVVVPEDEEAGEMCAATLRSLPRGGVRTAGVARCGACGAKHAAAFAATPPPAGGVCAACDASLSGAA
jgi:hypothetical protein